MRTIVVLDVTEVVAPAAAAAAAAAASFLFCLLSFSLLVSSSFSLWKSSKSLPHTAVVIVKLSALSQNSEEKELEK